MKMLGKPLQIARDMWSGFLDLIYPPYCLVCGVGDSGYLCPKCMEKIDLIEPPFCRKCGIPCESYHCPDCREREFAFECACSAGTFDGVLREAIHALKYDCQIPAADPLAELMARCFPATHLRGQVDIAVPVPIHRSRLLERGFNQAEELCRVFCERVGVVTETGVLCKPKGTQHQVDLPHDARAKNVKGAFAVRNAGRVAGKRILLVDDVFTTGSTLNEAAKTLLAAGCLSVRAYTLARSL